MKNEPYQVSVLVPVYGVEKYIERCVRSIFEQTYHNLDIVFVDDCTPDHSIDILKRVLEDYPDRKSQTRVIRHDRNRGLAAARNTAVAAARGEFLTHVDSDDWLNVDMIEKLVAEQILKDSDIVACESLYEYDHHSVKKSTTICKSKEEQIRKLLELNLEHVIWGRLIRRGLYIRNDIHAVEGVNLGEDAQVVPLLYYYARIFSKTEYVGYHYSCLNNDSYMSKLTGSYEQIYNTAQCNLATYSHLEKFFKAHAPMYLSYIEEHENEVRQWLVRMASRLVFKACKENNKEEFKKMMRNLQEYNNDLVGGRISAIRFFHNNFFLAKIICSNVEA